VDSLLSSGSASARFDPAPKWTFLTNHLLVLICIARNRELRVRDIAQMVGITERATQTILSDLDQDGYIGREHIGRRTRYHVQLGGSLRHPLALSSTIGDLLDTLTLPPARMHTTG
jgi:DNA-binding MarR family transcriptional regulator